MNHRLPMSDTRCYKFRSSRPRLHGYKASQELKTEEDLLKVLETSIDTNNYGTFLTPIYHLQQDYLSSQFSQFPILTNLIMFDGLDVTVRSSLYALTVLHLPSYSSEKWNHDFLKVFLVELGLSENLYEAYYPLTERSSGVSDILSTVTTDSASEAFLTIIDTAGLDRIDLFIGILVYLRFSGHYGAQGRVLFRNLIALVPLSQGHRIAIDMTVQEDLQHAADSISSNIVHTKTDVPQRSQAMRYLKIGTAAVLTGAVLAVTGGLAAPAIAVALTAMGGATVAVSVSTAAIAVMFGTAGAGLASYKMDQRTIGIKEFFIESYTSKNQMGLGSTVMLMVSGFMGSGEDYKRAFGVMPAHLGFKERLARFYQRFDPEKIHVADREAVMNSGTLHRHGFCKKLIRKYGRDPMNLEDLSSCLTTLEVKAQKAAYARMKEKEDKVILAPAAPTVASAAPTESQVGEKTKEQAEGGEGEGGGGGEIGGMRNDEYLAGQIRDYTKMSARYVAFALAGAVAKLNKNSTGASEVEVEVDGKVEGVLQKGDGEVVSREKSSEQQDHSDVGKQSHLSATASTTSAPLLSTASVASTVHHSTGNDVPLVNTASTASSVEGRDRGRDIDGAGTHSRTEALKKGWRTVDDDIYKARSSNANVGKLSTQDSLGDATSKPHIPATSNLTVKAPPPSSSSSSSSSSSTSSSHAWTLSSLNPFSTKAPIVSDDEEKSSTTDSANKAAATADPNVYEEIPHSQRKNNELASLLETYWNWSEYSLSPMYDLHLLRWESQLQLDIGSSIVSAWMQLGKKAAQDVVMKTFFAAIATAAMLPTLALTITSMMYSLWSLAVLRADQAGLELARALVLRPPGSPPVTLVGYSLGGRVIFSCLKALADIQFGPLGDSKCKGSDSGLGHTSHSSTATDEGDDEEEEDGEEFAASKKLSSSITPQTMNSTVAPGVSPNAAMTGKSDGANTRERETDSTPLLPEGATSGEKRDLSGIVMDVVILGAPLCSKSRGWRRARQMTVGRLINGYSTRDLVLAVSYRLQTLKGRIAGITPVTEDVCPGVENIDLSPMIASHLDYCSSMKEILDSLDLSAPAPPPHAQRTDEKKEHRKVSQRVLDGALSLKESIAVANVLYSIL